MATMRMRMTINSARYTATADEEDDDDEDDETDESDSAEDDGEEAMEIEPANDDGVNLKSLMEEDANKQSQVQCIRPHYFIVHLMFMFYVYVFAREITSFCRAILIDRVIDGFAYGLFQWHWKYAIGHRTKPYLEFLISKFCS